MSTVKGAKTPPEIIEQIKNADPSERMEALAKRLGTSLPTVKRYRAEGRAERNTIAREVLERRVEAEMPNALESLGSALRISRERMESEQSPEWVRETRQTAIALLDRMGVEKVVDPLAGTPDDALLDELQSRLGLTRK